VNRKTWGIAALMVALFFAFIGITSGLSGDHRAGAPAIGISLVALIIGVVLVKE
jgi:hypothetical protein